MKNRTREGTEIKLDWWDSGENTKKEVECLAPAPDARWVRGLAKGERMSGKKRDRVTCACSVRRNVITDK